MPSSALKCTIQKEVTLPLMVLFGNCVDVGIDFGIGIGIGIGRGVFVSC